MCSEFSVSTMRAYDYFLQWLQNHSGFCGSSFGLCFEYKAITMSNGTVLKKEKCFQNIIVFKFQSNCGTMGNIGSNFKSVSTFACVCMLTFGALSDTLSRHMRGRSHMSYSGPAPFSVFTTTSMDSAQKNILVKHCPPELGRTAEF